MVFAGIQFFPGNSWKDASGLRGRVCAWSPQEAAMTDEDQDLIRQLCTRVGTIMEDASVVALSWSDAEALSITDRVTALRRAARHIDVLLNAAAAVAGGNEL
jgi:hypothetical protein